MDAIFGRGVVKGESCGEGQGVGAGEDSSSQALWWPLRSCGLWKTMFKEGKKAYQDECELMFSTVKMKNDNTDGNVVEQEAGSYRLRATCSSDLV